MARQVRDSRLETREARARLRARDEPYWRLIHEGLHLGYRKRVRGAVWLARLYSGDGYIKRNLGRADDTEDAGDSQVLSFRQAQGKALDLEATLARGGPLPQDPYTVANAIDAYLNWYAAHRKSLADAKTKAGAFILPALGARPVAELTAAEIRAWHERLAQAPARARTRRFAAQPNTRPPGDPRARRATANRILTLLKATLNHAWRDGQVASGEAWRRVRPFRDVESPKIRYLTVEESRRLINACEPDFRQLAQAALFTGCRYGELTAMDVHDFNPDAGTVLVRHTKNGKVRHVPLTREGQRFFERLTAGRQGRMFLRDDGLPWGASHQQRPLLRACERAGIAPAVSFHVLRHTYGSMLAMRGVPLQVIAEALGHADTRITHRHYAHLLPSYVADTIRAHLPTFGVEADNVTALRHPRKEMTP